ncbi:low affinity iron permease family protein [Filimonas effusa]|uniref:Low affinity iron permease family protein n=1 Tax=Filimonas effusa TaxID=2508721 RepID=A0A4Q1D5Q7_9BACT|nr:low affinity iron permease family protein [Filimonas effusa]RXK83850.1 low affinity iron permease family protein [Filimonas effusa]
MQNKKPGRFKVFFDRFSGKVTHLAGSSIAFLSAFGIIIVWAVTGPIFHFSDTWQLVINTGTTIITFLMVFVIQQSQNKDTLALHLKLNELIAASDCTSNRLIDVEDLTEEELVVLKKFYVKLSQLAKNEKNLFATHSIDEAEERHEEKLNVVKGKKTRR